MKKKTTIVILVLLIPLIFLLTKLIAIGICDATVNSVYEKPHLGQTEKSVYLEAIDKLEQARKFAKDYYPSYEYQAIFYNAMEDYESALNILNEFEKNNPHSNKTFYKKGLIYDALGQRDSALKYYTPILVENNFLNNRASSASLYHWNFLIYGKDSAFKYLEKHNNVDDEIYMSLKNHLDTVSFKKYALENLDGKKEQLIIDEKN